MSDLFSKNISVGPASKFDLSSKQLTDFYKKNWVRQIALSNETFYKWQFRSAPENLNRDLNMVAIEKNKIIGIMGLNRRSFNNKGNLIKGAEMTTYVVAKAARGKGVGKSIMTALQEEYSFLAASGITNSALPIYLDKGFRFIKCLPRFVLIENYDLIKRFCKINSIGERIINRPKRVSASDFRLHSANPQNLSNLALKHAHQMNCFSRDFENLTWRYENHPCYKYNYAIISDSEEIDKAVGLIFRTDYVEGMKILHIIDLFGEVSKIKFAISFIKNKVREEKYSFADIICSNTFIMEGFYEDGWISINDEDYAQVPNLFYPLELRNPATSSIAIWCKEKNFTGLNIGMNHFVKGDLDLDRPTQAYFDKHGFPREYQ